MAKFKIKPEELDNTINNILRHIKSVYGVRCYRTKLKHTFDDLYAVHIKIDRSPSLMVNASATITLLRQLMPYQNNEASKVINESTQEFRIILHTEYKVGIHSRDIMEILFRNN